MPFIQVTGAKTGRTSAEINDPTELEAIAKACKAYGGQYSFERVETDLGFNLRLANGMTAYRICKKWGEYIKRVGAGEVVPVPVTPAVKVTVVPPAEKVGFEKLVDLLNSLDFGVYGQTESSPVDAKGGEAIRAFRVCPYFTNRKGHDQDEWPVFTGRKEAVAKIKKHFAGVPCQIDLFEEEKGWFTVCVMEEEDSPYVAAKSPKKTGLEPLPIPDLKDLEAVRRLSGKDLTDAITREIREAGYEAGPDTDPDTDPSQAEAVETIYGNGVPVASEAPAERAAINDLDF